MDTNFFFRVASSNYLSIDEEATKNELCSHDGVVRASASLVI